MNSLTNTACTVLDIGKLETHQGATQIHIPSTSGLQNVSHAKQQQTSQLFINDIYCTDREQWDIEVAVLIYTSAVKFLT